MEARVGCKEEAKGWDLRDVTVVEHCKLPSGFFCRPKLIPIQCFMLLVIAWDITDGRGALVPL